MDPDVISFAVVMVVIIGSIAALGAIGTVMFRKFREAMHPSALPSPNSAKIFDERFAQLQQSIDAVAVEVERIAEGQRFTTRLLAENARVAAITDGR